jgi:UDP-N-acetylglucosamine:LPS N-acetylglucosamine transferase
MRILVLSHEFPPVGGGGGHVAKDLCQGLSELGHELRIFWVVSMRKREFLKKSMK